MKKRILCFLLLFLLLWLGSACAESAGGWIASREDLNGKRMGIVTGTSFEAPTLQCFPDSQYLYFGTNSDVVTALVSNKIDGFLADEPVIRMICKEVPEITYLPEKITQDDYAFGFGKNSQRADRIRGQFNEMLSQIMTNGTLNALYDKWFGDDEAVKTVDLTGFSGENGTLNVVTSCTSIPFSYIKDGKMAGIAIELTEMFCRRYGYTPSIEDVDAAARIPGIVTGKYDMCAAPLTITEERRESINFSEPYYQGGIVLAVRKMDVAAQTAEKEETSVSSPMDVKRMGIVTGTSFEAPTLQFFPSSEYLYYNSYTDVAAALINKKIDGFLGDEPALRILVGEVPEITYLPEKLVSDEYAFGFGKSGQRPDMLRRQFNEMLAEIKADGTLEALGDKWFGEDEAVKVVDLKNGYSGENGKLNVVTTATDVPFSYVKDNQYVGLSIELVEMFCRRFGYTPVIADVDFSARMPGLVSGKYDMCASSMAITEERKESISFSDPFYQGGIVLAVRKADAPAQPSESAGLSGQGAASTLAAYDGKRIGVQTGTTFDAIVLKALPDAKLVYINSSADLIAALESGKIDAFAVDEPAAKQFCTVNPHLTMVDEYLDSFEFGIVLPKTGKGNALLEELNAWLVPLNESGAVERVIEKWANGSEEEKTLPDYAAFPAAKGTLTLATEGDYVPMTYYRGTEIVGAEIDLIAQFCEANGYGLHVQVMNFDGILPAVQSGKADFAAAGISITDERRESVNFSVPYYSGGTVLVAVKKEQAAAGGTVASLSQLNGKRIGVQTGTICGALAEARLPKAQIYYFNTVTDVLAALNAGKLDAGCMDEPTLRFLKIENPQLVILQEYLDESNLAAVFPKTEAGQALCSQYSEFLEKLWADGTMKEIDSVWFGKDDGKRTVMDFASLPAANGTLRMAADLSMVPFTYMKDNKIVGYDVDVAARFCREYGYALEIVPMDFGGILASVQSGKCDFASSCITITEERAESVLFSSPNYYGGIAMGVLEAGNAAAQAAGTVRWQDYNGKRLGVLVGPLMEDAAKEYFPDSEYLLYNSYPDCIAALLAGKIDAYLGDELSIKTVHAEQPEIDYIHDRITQNNYSFAFRKNDPDSAALCAELNDFLARSWANGTMQELDDIWFGVDEDRKIVDMSGLTGENGTIRVVTTSTDAPFSYIKDGKNVGYDIDLVVRFCRDRGYALELGDVDFAGRIPAIQSGKYDFTTDMNVTPEREEQVLFSDPTGYGGIVLAVLSSDLAVTETSQSSAEAEIAEETFLDSILASFNKTFIRENRWELFWNGVLTTLLITVLSILFGTALGFGVFMLCRNGNIIANGVTRFSMWLVQGMPMVVLLMILYYIIFGSVAISGVVVAVIGFTLTFGASVFGLLKMGVGTIDRGQYEAAYALGYANRRTFFRIILPQAIPHILPAYKGEIVGLIKATAIVGYIAVQDLTKMGDIVRSRTYEAFFPLIAVTVIYFILEGLLGFMVSKIQIRMNPKKRKAENILKGVSVHD